MIYDEDRMGPRDYEDMLSEHSKQIRELQEASEKKDDLIIKLLITIKEEYAIRKLFPNLDEEYLEMLRGTLI